jgi:PAS domain S-box-containing protein
VWAKQDQEVYETGESFYSERYAKQPSGEIEYRSLSKMLVTGDSGEVIGICTIGENITKRREAEEALRENEQLYKAILDASPVTITLRNLSGRYLYLNKSAAALVREMGVDVSKLMGKSLEDFIPQSTDEPTAQDTIDRVVATGEAVTNVEYETPRAPGRTFLQNVVPVFGLDGKVSSIATTSLEVTEAKNAEKEIAKKTALLQTILDAAPNFISFRDTEERFVFVNDKMTAEWGGRPEDYIGKTPLEKFGVTPGVSVKQLVEESYESGQPIIDREIQPTNRPGKTFRYSVIPVFNPDSSKLGVLTVGQDITAQKNSEAAARESETLVRTVMDNSPITIALTDLEGRLQLVNKGFLETFKTTEEQIIGQFDTSVMSAEHAPEIIAHNELALESGAAITQERMVTLPSGEVYHRYLTKFPVRDQAGAIIGLGTVAADISELRKAEENLHEMESRYSEILRIAPEAIISVGTDGVILMFNDAAETIFGYDRNEMLGQPLDILLPTKTRSLHSNYMKEFVASPETARLMGGRGDTSGRRRDGSEFPASASISKLQTGGETILTVTLRDITERKKAEESLRESEENLREILEKSPIGVAIVSHAPVNGAVEAKRLFSNEALAQMFGGGSTEEFVKADISDTWIDREQYHAVNDKMRNDVDMQDFEVQRRRLDGTKWWVSMNTRPIRFDNQNCTMVWHFDITERKRAEESLRAALSEAQRANEAKSEFLAVMSHELRTPLNAIMGFSEILSGQFFGALGSEKYVEYSKDIKNSGQHLLQLIDDILDLSAIEAGKHQLDKEFLDFQEIADDCGPIVDEGVNRNGISYDVKVPENLPVIFADRRALKQILLNLLSNATKFTPKGGKVKLSAEALNDTFVLEISDTGAGIGADKIATLTEPFVRGEQDPHKAQDGAGLGLAIVKSLVDLHEGELIIESEIGVGTTITVSLPFGGS